MPSMRMRWRASASPPFSVFDTLSCSERESWDMARLPVVARPQWPVFTLFHRRVRRRSVFCGSVCLTNSLSMVACAG